MSGDLRLESPRTRVALRLLGVDAHQLEPRSLKDFPGNKEAKARAREVFEQRRNALVERINKTRLEKVTPDRLREQEIMDAHIAQLPSQLGHNKSSILTPTVAIDEEALTAELKKKEQQRLDTLKKFMKRDISKILKDEITKAENDKQSQEQQRKYEKKLAEKAEELAEAKKKREADQLATQQRRKEMLQRKEDDALALKKELDMKMREKMKKVEKVDEVDLDKQ